MSPGVSDKLSFQERIPAFQDFGETANGGFAHGAQGGALFGRHVHPPLEIIFELLPLFGRELLENPARIFEFLAAGDAYAFASMTETFGLACVEAAIAGLPIVASNLDVMREVLTAEDGECAALFVEVDAAGMARGLADLFARPQFKARLSAAGRRLRDKYSPARMCASYEALLLV